MYVHAQEKSQLCVWFWHWLWRAAALCSLSHMGSLEKRLWQQSAYHPMWMHFCQETTGRGQSFPFLVLSVQHLGFLGQLQPANESGLSCPKHPWSSNTKDSCIPWNGISYLLPPPAFSHMHIWMTDNAKMWGMGLTKTGKLWCATLSHAGGSS